MSTITDEMVEAACFSYWEIYREMWRPSGVLTPSLDLSFDELSSFLKNPTRIAMRAALEAAERAAWRPIEDAPRDGREGEVREGGKSLRIRRPQLR